MLSSDSRFPHATQSLMDVVTPQSQGRLPRYHANTALPPDRHPSQDKLPPTLSFVLFCVGAQSVNNVVTVSGEQ